nr:hypothetical protein [Tanacetum cinerariifolium]
VESPRSVPEFDEKKPESEVNVSPSSSAQSKKQDDKTKREAKGKSLVESFTRYRDFSAEFEDYYKDSINEVNADGTLVPTVGQISPNSTNTFSAAGNTFSVAGNTFSVAGPSIDVASPTHGKYSFIDASELPDDPDMPELEDITYSDDEDDVGAEADFNNLETSITVSPIPATRVHKDHHVTQIIGDLSLTTQTRSMTRVVKDQVDFLRCSMMTFILVSLPAFFYKENPRGYIKLLKIQVGLKLCKKSFFNSRCRRNKKDERAIVVRNKARLVTQGHTQEDGINYEEVFAPLARIEAIRLFLAYASFMGFMVYQIDVKSAFLYETIEEEVYVCQPLGFEDPDHPDKMSSIGELTFFLGLQVKQKKDRIFISQDKYVAEILRKFRLTDGKSASTPIDTEKPLLKDPNGEDVDVHTYRLMIGSLMYLTSSRPDIMFAVYTCARFQVTPKSSHLHVVKRIFRYLKGKPHLGLWYLKDSPFDLVAFSDSDYAGASQDRKSTIEGCQFFGCKLISWAMDSESTAGLWVVLSGMESLKRMLHVTNILSAGYLTTQQMVLNSPCLTHIKNWLVQIK